MRTAITVAFSMPQGLRERINERAKDLGEVVANPSHYIRRLVELDMAEDILGRYRIAYESKTDKQPKRAKN